MTRDQRLECYDAGIAAAAAHLTAGHSPANPHHRTTRRAAYWARGFTRASQALRKVQEQQP